MQIGAMSNHVLAHLSSLTEQLRGALMASSTAELFSRAWRAEATENTEPLSVRGDEALIDSVAQAVTCGCFGLQCFRKQLHETAGYTWLIDGSGPLMRELLSLCGGATSERKHSVAVRDATRRIAQVLERDGVGTLGQGLAGDATFADMTFADIAVYFYEHFVATHDRRMRRRRGIFYTPPALVSYIVRHIDRMLEHEFLLKRGLADDATWRDVRPCAESLPRHGAFEEDPFVRVLDPAMGAGTFLLQAAAAIRDRFRRHAVPRDAAPDVENELWNCFVARNLLPRLWGHELMLPSLVLAKLAMVAWLAETGFQFRHESRLHFYLANTLQQPRVGAEDGAGSGPFTVILGNPPFSSISDNQQGWMRELLRGRAPDRPSPVANYFLSQGAPLGERKHWLEDDYVKFMRFAHWQIEKAGAGVVGLVTNHAYLDNSTFHGMREQLLATFPRISVLDLRGNTRNRRRPRPGAGDESVFGIEQGVAISLFRRSPVPNNGRKIEHAELWGTRAAKLKALEQPAPATITWKTITPRPPSFFFVPKNQRLEKEYEAGFRLCDIMPVNSTAAVTARDSFVVAMDENELRERIQVFADPRRSDEEIRARFFTNTRSRKYPPGDTRGWRVADARRRMRADPQWEDHLRPCLYRPFDRRQVFWTPWMIDWPRSQVMDPLASGGNLALIARRQSPPSWPCNFFWISDTIVIDGVIRSDNRGSESVFPLFVPNHHDCQPPLLVNSDQPSSSATMQPNFSHAFVQACSSKLGLPWSPEGRAPFPYRLAPCDLFYYMYGFFHSPSYRNRFAEQLCIDFPRVLIPHDRQLFGALSQLGKVLAGAHLLSSRSHAPGSHDVAGLTFHSDGKKISLPPFETVTTGYPKYHNQNIWLNERVGIGPVDQGIWDFHAGTYQVCHKWLKDRRHRVLSSSELHRYRLILRAVDETLRTTAEIDREIARYGGWENAFRT